MPSRRPVRAPLPLIVSILKGVSAVRRYNRRPLDLQQRATQPQLPRARQRHMRPMPVAGAGGDMGRSFWETLRAAAGAPSGSSALSRDTEKDRHFSLTSCSRRIGRDPQIVVGLTLLVATAPDWYRPASPPERGAASERGLPGATSLALLSRRSVHSLPSLWRTAEQRQRGSRGKRPLPQNSVSFLTTPRAGYAFYPWRSSRRRASTTTWKPTTVARAAKPTALRM
jgi:hypothetical protein